MSSHDAPIKTGNARKTLMSRHPSPGKLTAKTLAARSRSAALNSLGVTLPAKTVAARFRSAAFNSLGVTLLETLIALAIFSSAGTAVLLGVGAAHTSSDRVKASAVAANLARNQMEYVSSLSYVPPPGTYTSIADDSSLNITLPPGFGVSAAAQTYVADDGLSGSIEKVVVTVTRDGRNILVLESLRSRP